MNQITDKTYVIMLKGGYKCWITKEQGDFIKTQLINKTGEFVVVDELFIKSSDISFIIPASEIDREDRVRRGDWQCRDCGRWHPREEKCGCQGGRF
jgi:hypothetical protein